MDLSRWYRVYTKTIFILKGCYGYGETRNVFSLSVQKPLSHVQAVQLPRLKGVGIGLRTETCVNWGGAIAMVSCLYQSNIYIKRKLRVSKDQICTSIVGAETLPTCTGRQTTPSERSRYRPKNGNLRKLGWTYCHGIVLAPRQYLCQKEATGMERPDMYFPTRGKKPSYLCGTSNYSVSMESV